MTDRNQKEVNHFASSNFNLICKSDNNYVRRYHFVKVLSRNWKDIQLQKDTKTNKFKSYSIQFSKLRTATDTFDLFVKKYEKRDILISYSSNAKLVNVIQKFKKYK